MSSVSPVMGSVKSESLPSGSTANGAAANQNLGPDGQPRSGRACLACRRLKTRCDGADDPPCKRCRAGNHDCIFVESKRGKRPARKPVDQSLADKFKTVEKTLEMVLDSMNSGNAPDQSTLKKLQETLKEGLAKEEQAKQKERDREPEPEGKREVYPAQSSGSPSDELQHKRQRTDRSSFSGSNTSPLSINTNMSPSTNLQSTPRTTSLSILADASLAAEIDGRSQLTGLDPSFNLSRVTEALAAGKELEEGALQGQTPALLSKGIINPETAVELFRVFFDYAYIHLPLLDPAQNTATSVCQRSAFLFTVICAVASRFHADPSLHTKCYDEAHQCFVDCVANGERSIESVQACMILTVWTSAPRAGEDRPQRAWLYFGMAVRMGLELGLFRPPPFVDQHLSTNGNAQKANPWANLPKTISEEEQRDALNRERTWLLAFVIDRNMSAVMGRPYQVHEAKPLMIPLHSMSLPFDLGVIAHQELQSIIGQVMDTFRDRIYGLSSASDEMPSPVVMKLFNSRMDDWKKRWCPVPGEPISNNLQFYFYSSKLFLNTIPLHTMLRMGESVDDPEVVNSTISAAKSIMDLAHNYAELGVLLHCPDVNFLLLLYAAVFLVKVKASNSRFAQLVDPDDLQRLMLRAIEDCQKATCSVRHAASTCAIMLRALFASWKAMTNPSLAASIDGTALDPSVGSLGLSAPAAPGAPLTPGFNAPPADGIPNPFSSSLGLHGTLAGAPTSPAPYAYLSSPFGIPGQQRPSGYVSGAQTPSHWSAGAPGDPFAVDSFLNDSHFFNSVLVSQGADGFFAWDTVLDSAGALDDGLGNQHHQLAQS